VELPLDFLQTLHLADGTSVAQAVTALAAEVRENVKLRRAYWCDGRVDERALRHAQFRTRTVQAVRR
jgi:hypothetical protein